MKRNKIIYNRWLRTLLLSSALLIGGGWMAWGQERTIKLDYDSNKHDSVFVDTKVIYVIPGQERELFIPELRISIVTKHPNNHRYNWYVHWYVKSKNNTKGTIAFKSITTTKDEAQNQGGEWGRNDNDNEKTYTTTNYFVNENTDGGLVWSKRLKEYFNDPGGFGMDASTITYQTATDTYQDGDTVYCDVSTYQDGSLTPETNQAGTIGTYTEPTLTKRTKYIIKHYQECIEKYVEAKEEDKTIRFDYPAIRNAKNYDNTGSLTGDNLNRTINFSMPSLPDNYFWVEKTDGSIQQGEYFQYKIEGITQDYIKFHLTTRETEGSGSVSLALQQSQRIPKQYYDNMDGKDIVVYVRAANNSGKQSDDLAKFIFHPLQGVGFEVEDNIKNDNSRYPRRDTLKYELIGHIDFDLGEPETTLTEENNIASDPFGYFSVNQTTYGFWDKNIYPLLRTQWDGGTPYYFASSNQNMYGLFRSASEFSGYIEQQDNSSNQWKYRYYFPTLLSHDSEKFSGVDFYDRTYYISQDETDPSNQDKIDSENGSHNLKKKYGYFYYVDASNEPGTVVEVPINGTLCPNTEITVTAWLADMTRANWISSYNFYPLAPNLNILFIGKRGEEEQVLHRFTTGDALVNYSENGTAMEGGTPKYNSYLMQWQQLYYTFVLENNETFDSYYLEIQNNEPHTDGADYAIDDIRIFKTKPQVRLVQAGDLCDTEVNTVRFVTDYNRALQVLGLKPNQEVPENQRVQYGDLPELLKEYINGKSEDRAEVLKYFTSIYYAVYANDDRSEPIQINYNNLKADKQNYRISYVSTKLEDMVWTKTFTYDPDDPNPSIASAPVYLNGELKPGIDYIARLSTNPVDNDLSIENNLCALVGDPFQLIVAGKMYEIVKGKSEVILPENAIISEEYTIKGKFWYKENINSGDFDELENAKFDWFFGTLEEFITPNTIVTQNGGSYSLQKALNTYNESKTTDAIKLGIKNALEAKYGIKSDDDPNKPWRLILGETEFKHTMTQKYQPIVVQASADQEGLESLGKDVLYCSNPVQISLGGIPPTIDPGDPDVPDPDPKDPEDPDDPKDDPKDPQPDKDPADGSHVRSVRVGLVQIQDMQENNGTLRIPIYSRKSAKNEIFVVDNSNINIGVIETSDKDRKTGLMNQTVATLTALIDVDANPKWEENYFKIQFNRDAVNSTTGFREGFWYMVNIPYAVKDKDGNGSVVYRGSMKLTLKIVPEYVTWVGSDDKMHNWNNDGPNHWRRSKDTELYTTDVANKNGIYNEAYTPMRFTKVTILGNKEGNTPYAAYPHLYALEKQADKYILDMAPTVMDGTIGAATKNIEYDLLADPDYEQELFGNDNNPDKAQGHSYSCVRFYGNTCDDIYIKPESEILHTEYLTYDTAHVDYEMEPNRWYMLASPLKGVVSGDMYLPTGTGVGSYARQETPAFEKITYEDNTKYTRWNPAVYMRGWKKSSVTVVRPGDDTKFVYGSTANWSNLYNDVDVAFTPGTGFSIGTKADETKLTGNKVLFRLPKNDSSYSYYASDNNTTSDNKVLENRTGNGRFLTDDILKNSTDGYKIETTEMFGNPFMSHLNMTKFFPNGQGTYYILSESGTETDILGNGYTISTKESDPKYVAPLQSFIVPNMTSAKFTTEMIAKAPTGNDIDNGLRSATTAPAEESLPQLRITATRDGVRNTAVVAGLVTASDSYVEGEDAALLINEEVAAPQVYTLAGNQMTAINVTPELTEIPLGIYGKDATPVELSFRVSGAMKNVKLVDKQTGKRYDVTDGLTLTVPGNTSGRYFLNGSIATSNEIIARNRIIFYNSAPGRIDISSVDPLSEVTVYDIAGRALRTLRNLNTPTASAEHLAPGIYVVRAESGSQVVSEKVEVK